MNFSQLRANSSSPQMTTLNDYIEEFRELDDSERLETLVEIAEELPPLSADRAAVPFPTQCRVSECQTAVHVWVDLLDGRIELEADVPHNAPTVRGLVTLVVRSLQGMPAADVLQLPDDLLPILRLDKALGMQRQQGLRGLIQRIKRETRRQLALS